MLELNGRIGHYLYRATFACVRILAPRKVCSVVCFDFELDLNFVDFGGPGVPGQALFRELLLDMLCCAIAFLVRDRGVGA